MMQQDTFWRRNLFELNLEDDHSFDGLFDQIGKDEQSQRAEWVNGMIFFEFQAVRVFFRTRSIIMKLNGSIGIVY